MSDSTKTIGDSSGLASLSMVVDAALQVVEERKERVVIVGGFVRDLLMNHAVGDYDIDLVVEGDGLAFAGALQQKIGGDRREHRSFLTAKLTAPFSCSGGAGPFLSEVDIATARSEEYLKPGALPVVTPTTLENDLWRRDFASNALALPLAVYRDFLAGTVSQPSLAAHVVDPCGGLSDLKLSTLRILHPQSFIDDPTRLFRAVRYAVRLSFHFDRGTLAGFYEAVKSGALATLSPRRVWNEVVCALDEAAPSEVIQEFVERGLFSHLPIVEPISVDGVVAALAAITAERGAVSHEEFREAAKLIVLASMVQHGREDVALATSEGGRMVKRAKGALSGALSVSEGLSRGQALAAFGLHGDPSFLSAL